VSNLAQRLLTAAVAAPILILAIAWSQPWAVQAIVLLAVGIGLHEWMRMTLPAAAAADRWFATAAGAALAVLLCFLSEVPMAAPMATAAAVIACFLWFLFRYGAMDTVAQRIAFVIGGWFYVLLLLYLALLKTRPAGSAWIFLALTMAWGSDTGAYFLGRFLGPRFPAPLYPDVSPKKTRVGAIGGLVGGWVFAAVGKLWYGHYWGLELSWADTFLLAVPANVLGQTGDLAESLIKRSVGVKDSGALLPGHGGMLDRVDALLFVAPWVYAYSRWLLGAW
jgi:phosphatidate cytidylyltransferase